MIRGLLPALAIAGGLITQANAETRPIVVELFGAQGCPACPPADALLDDLAKRADVIALGFHVTYWDRSGWKDSFSLKAATERQRTYVTTLSNHTELVTPQFVIEGRRLITGADRNNVERAMADLHPSAAVEIVISPDRRSVALNGAGGQGSVLVLRIAPRKSTVIGSGENAHIRVIDVNAVKALAMLGAWTGSPANFSIEPPQSGEGLAILVQAPDGKYLGAAMVPPPPAT